MSDSASSVAERISQANRKLQGRRVSLKVKNGKLWVQGTLPPRPGSSKTRWHQQSISTRQPLTKVGLKCAIDIAKRIDAQLVGERFNWSEWANLRQKDKQDYTAKDWIDAFREDWESRRMHAARTWRKEYGIVFDHLELNHPLGELQVMRALRKSQPDTRNRIRFCAALQALCKFAKLDIDLSRYRGSYGQHAVNPRDLPSDVEIEHMIDAISDPYWQRIAAIYAVYGIRTQEIQWLDLRGMPDLQVLKGKTGARMVTGFHPVWIGRWQLNEWQGWQGEQKFVSETVAKQFKRLGLPEPYTFRHCMARRMALDYEMPSFLGANQLGHSERVHRQVYRCWIDEADIQARIRQAALRGPVLHLSRAQNVADIDNS